MNNFSLEGKVCVVIGGAGLLGRAFAQTVAKAGATVVIADINEEKGKAVVEDITQQTGHAVFVHCDTTDPVSVRALAEGVKQRYGRVDAMVNSAHIPSMTSSGAKMSDVDFEQFSQGIISLAGGTFLSAREFGKIMEEQGGGSIVIIGSMYGHFPPRFEMYEGLSMTQPAEYAIAKGGLTNFTRYFAKLVGPKGVRVNMLSPGGIEGGQSEEFKKRFNQHALLDHRMLKADEVAPTLVFLFSDASAHMTGQNLAVDSGWTL